ncbi:DUF3298 and DUF4163 domain-containing protein [Rasiella rasia]|uniref:DUF3298 and DUF4163 domain-containing protein n=1 Tax=Rasiella rasia TaxID=2744027 RepID=A0A6G6GQQ6_9FLAO|nr:DUF3298 and DUF4163 domain-containing protein [Rasiella rasia]QIE60051.1 DUF3298 and DUF4163 domain-containing protein [Rasiella rasia]
MNNKIYLLLTVLALFASCKKALNTTTVIKSSKVLKSCSTMSCPDIDMEYFEVGGAEKATSAVNADIKNFVIQSLYIGEEEAGSNASTIEQAMEDFISMYRTHSAEFPDLSAEYFAEITVLPIYNSKDILSVSFRNYLYTGGAHGYGAVNYKNYHPKTGDALYYEDLFNDVDAFSKLAEAAFRTSYEIPKNGSINATGFWFEDDAFYLPETVGVSKEFIMLHYNQYEIAPYAAGPITVDIPISDVKDLLKIPVE